VHAVPKVGSCPRDDERGASIHGRNVPISPRVAVQDPTERMRIVVGIAALQVLWPGAGKPDILRRDAEAADRAILKCHDRGWASCGDLVEPIRAMDGPDALGAEFAQR